MTVPLPAAAGPGYTRGRQTLATIQQLRFYPLAAVSGEGCWLVDDTGRRLLDLSATWAAASLGYGHPALTEAITRAARSPGGAGYGSIGNAQATELGETLLALRPGPDRRVYLGHSGSDANEAVIRAIVEATGRRRLVAFHGSYHGGRAGSSAFSGLMLDAQTATNANVTLVDYPDSYRDGPGQLERILGDIDTALGAPCASGVAALLVEPIMSDGGLIVPPPGFLSAVEQRCRAAGVLLVCDEVKVGLGRTGTMHAFDADGVQPDVVTYGKGLGGGLPIAAALGPVEIMNVADAMAMLTTVGNPVCCAGALAVLHTIEREGLVAHSAVAGAQLTAGLRQLQERYEMIGDVRGRGLAVGVELIADPDTRAPAPALAAKVVFRAWQLGVVLFYVGPHSNVLELTPPLVISDTEIDQALAILDQAFTDVGAGRVPDSAVAEYAGW